MWEDDVRVLQCDIGRASGRPAGTRRVWAVIVACRVDMKSSGVLGGENGVARDEVGEAGDYWRGMIEFLLGILIR